ncbi:MAG: AbrB/MazE/SpoVT family DNA-binding domain-containing protein [Methanosarcinales archaeon]
MMEVKSRVGPKGELYPPMQIRKKAGIECKDEIIFIAKEGEIIIRKVPNPIDLLNKPALISVTCEEFEKESKEMQEKARKHFELEVGT